MLTSRLAELTHRYMFEVEGIGDIIGIEDHQAATTVHSRKEPHQATRSIHIKFRASVSPSIASIFKTAGFRD